MFRGRFPCLLSVFNASCGVGGHQENEFLAQRCLQIMSFQYQLLAAFQHLVLVCFTLNFILGILVLKKIIMLQIFFLLYFIYQFLAFSTEDCIGIQRGMYPLDFKINSFDFIKYSVWVSFPAFLLYIIRIYTMPEK